MAQQLHIEEKDIRDFIHKEFPGHEVLIGNEYWFVHVDPSLDWRLHFEYNQGEIHFDIEGDNWRDPRNFFRNRLANDNRFTPKHWGRHDCRWTLNKNVESWEEIKDAFREINFILRPHVLAWRDEIGVSKRRTEIESDAKVSSKFQLIGSLLDLNIRIPNYQRPYVWTQKNVEQLLNDINHARINGKLQYLIGSIILHQPTKDETLFNIVDGQQRLTTLCLILQALGNGHTQPELEYNHSESFTHIKENFNHILQWIGHNLSLQSKKEYADYILESCCVVEIIVSDLSEAFQLFETQNGRGKELEAYNLLKAYHLRAMTESTTDEKHACDIRWEDATTFSDRQGISYDLLRQLINENLYRIRVWTRGDEAGKFSKKQLDEFKGLTFGKSKTLDFAYQNLMLQQMIARSFMKGMNNGLYKVKERFEHGDPSNIDPFVTINQMIVNGKPFFDYIETYVEIYKRLFIDLESSQLADFKSFYKRYCKEYQGSWRIGDGYVRQVYKSAIILLFDRFGEIGVRAMYKDLYAVIYIVRLLKSQVRYSTMMKQGNGGWVFTLINQAKTLSDLHPIKIKATEYKDKVCNGATSFSVEIIENAIKNI
ncbi:MAG: DUF262 domain-containing protein [Bacteroidales bacterium]|nr:DUF262 domain-containing protein [Bacteroidales bacterium]